jgi:hypothetical protein
MNTQPIIGLIKVILLVSKSLIVNDENTNTLGIKQNNNPFHIPRKLILIDLNFSYFNIDPPIFNNIVVTKNKVTTVIYPDRL